VFNARKRLLSLAGRKHTTVLFDSVYGLKILLPAWDANVIICAMRGSILHPHITEIFRSVIRPGYTFVDGGANIGFYSILAGSLLKGRGVVVSFEPDPRNIPVFKANTVLNGLSEVVRLVPKALSNTAAECDLWSEPVNTWGGGLIRAKSSQSVRTKVLSTTLDGYLAAEKIPPVDVVKLDIEGAEPLALEGMRTALESARLLVYEVNKPGLDGLGITPMDLIEQTNTRGRFTLTLVTDERRDEIVPLENGRCREILNDYGWANVISAKGEVAAELAAEFVV
jgi:FkbM family methyltransferase